MLDSENLWQFSWDFYERENVGECCLYWQDNHGLNINLLLLVVYCYKHNYQIPELQTLSDAISEWQTKYQREMRDFRKHCKSLGDDVYEKAKQLELTGERIEQYMLIQALGDVVEVSAADISVFQSVWDFYQIPMNNCVARFLAEVEA